MSAEDLKKANEAWNSTQKKLKTFQKKTVNRVVELFLKENSTKRVLVSDEVGLGKTFVAKGVVDRLRIELIKKSKTHFKIAYICGNQIIARQNVVKLISDSDSVNNSEDRLSMQHYHLSKERINSGKNFTSIVAMSPITSFSLKGQATGLKRERALMFATLKNAHYFDGKNEKMMNSIFMCAKKRANIYDWNTVVNDYLNGIKEIESKTNEIPYLKNKLDEHSTRIKEIIDNFELGQTRSNNNSIKKLRQLFAIIGSEMIDVDLVIMDEFQRFSELIEENGESETQILANRFLKSESSEQAPFVLLLSATPYKPYQTRYDSEIRDNVSCHEFKSVTDFLTHNGQSVDEKWIKFGGALENISSDNFEYVKMVKEDVEKALYGIMCRTERLSVDIPNNLIETFKEPLDIDSRDVFSYISAHRLLSKIDSSIPHHYLPTSYSENIPYVYSFLNGYKISEKIRVNAQKKKYSRADTKFVVIPKGKVVDFKPLDIPNAKMRRVFDIAGLNDEKINEVIPYLLWIPPTIPYYKLEYPFNKAPDNYSKTLIFSSWVMVPRCASSLLSYEADRRVNVIYKNKVGIKNMLKNTEKYRNETGKRRFSEQIDVKNNTNVVLFYPSKTAASIWNVKNISRNQELKELKETIKKAVEEKLDKLKEKYNPVGAQDDRWIYLAFPLLDKMEDKSLDFRQFVGLNKSELEQRFDRLNNEIETISDNKLGAFPEKLSEYLTNIAIGSPAVCLLRALGGNVLKAYQITAELVRYIFFGREPTCLLNAFYKKDGQSIDYAAAICNYCIAGCFQSVIDEYIYTITDGDNNIDPSQPMINACCSASVIKINELTKEDQDKKDTQVQLNSFTCRFAICFATDKLDEKDTQRSSNVRLAFNSPFRPFVLTSTSLGQEGLDFHHYCRKIIHWNLPNNPIDFEQREGRIDRYKSLFIRQNIANRYRDDVIPSNAWSYIFNRALNDMKDDEKASGLIPFWCLQAKNDEKLVPLERHLLLYPFSKESFRYDDLMKTLANYRLTIGHPRQEELLHTTLERIKDSNKLKELFINLSPWTKKE